MTKRVPVIALTLCVLVGLSFLVNYVQTGRVTSIFRMYFGVEPIPYNTDILVRVQREIDIQKTLCNLAEENFQLVTRTKVPGDGIILSEHEREMQRACEHVEEVHKSARQFGYE